MSLVTYPKLTQPLLTLLGTFLLALSFSTQANTQLEQEISQYVAKTMDELITVLKENESLYAEDSERFYQDLDQELSKVIDFKRIAMKVMGKYGRKATKQERIDFVSVFKRSLYKTYANTLLENTDVNASVNGTTINTRNPKKAKVDLDITSGNGATFPVVYAMHKGKDGVYRVENIVVLGINIGLALRDHFQKQFKQHKGNIGSVIESWSFDKVAEQSA